MCDRILVATDGSDCATAGLVHAIDLAADWGATLRAIHVVDTSRDGFDESDDEVLDALDGVGSEILDDAVEAAERAGVRADSKLRRGDPATEILDETGDVDADVVVVGTHGRSGLERVFFGSAAEAIVREANAPVLTVREDALEPVRYPYERILVPTDGSEGALTAVELAADLAKRCDATVDVLSVVDAADPGFDVRPAATRARLESRAEEWVAAAAGLADEAGAPSVETETRLGVVASEITEHADERGADLIVLGTRGRSGVRRSVPGRVAKRIVRSAPVPVLRVDGTADRAE